MSHAKAYEVVGTQLMAEPRAWVCAYCLVDVLKDSPALDGCVDDPLDVVQEVAEELRTKPGFERAPERCSRCAKAALVALRYVPSR